MLNISKHCAIIDRCSSIYKNIVFKELGICSSHSAYFFFLIKNPGVTQEELSKRLVINKRNVTRSLQYLEENSFIYRTCDDNDKRINHIYLTQKGIDLLPIIRSKIKVFNDNVSKNLNSEEIDMLNSLLEKITKSAVNFVRNEEYLSWKWFLNT